MTKEERHLWHDFLKTYPVRFLRQKVIDDYIVDFYCASAKLVIELDGGGHYEEKEHHNDNIRTEHIEAYGLTVIRIPNNEINCNFKGVCEYIDTLIQESLRLAEPHTSLVKVIRTVKAPPLAGELSPKATEGVMEEFIHGPYKRSDVFLESPLRAKPASPL